MAKESGDESAYCQLAVTSSTGKTGYCNAVHTGRGHFFSAGHCFPRGDEDLRESLILVHCGTLFIDNFTQLRVSLRQGVLFSEDIAGFKSDRFPREEVSVSKFPAVYFDRTRVKPGVECEIRTLRGDVDHPVLVRIPVQFSSETLEVRFAALNSAQRIIHRRKDGADLPKSQGLREGDSGSALLCRQPRQKFELVGIAATYATDRFDGGLRQNSFSPAFGEEAVRVRLGYIRSKAPLMRFEVNAPGFSL